MDAEARGTEAKGGRHVAVVDDEAATRAMVGDYLALQGFDVSALDGGAALRGLMAERPPDLVLLDLNMPDEDGLSLVRFVKGTSAVPVILLTATASPVDRAVGLERGADDHLTEPCDLRELRHACPPTERLCRGSSGCEGREPSGPAPMLRQNERSVLFFSPRPLPHRPGGVELSPRNPSSPP